jgi:hypothetical protein
MKMVVLVFLLIMSLSSLLMGVYGKFIELRERRSLSDGEREAGSMFSLLAIVLGVIFAGIALFIA